MVSVAIMTPLTQAVNKKALKQALNVNASFLLSRFNFKDRVAFVLGGLIHLTIFVLREQPNLITGCGVCVYQKVVCRTLPWLPVQKYVFGIVAGIG